VVLAEQLETIAGTNVYVPATCLQGEDLPAHVRWEPGEVTTIRVRVPAKSIIDRHDRVVDFSAFKVSGFLGLVFETRHVDTGKLRVTVAFQLLDRMGRTLRQVEREVLLFRPLLKVEPIPLSVFGPKINEHGVTNLQPPLGVSNVGDGTALVFVQLVDTPTARISQPARIGEFFKRYRDDLLKGVREVAKDFPKYSPLLGAYASILESSSPPSESIKRRLRSLDRRLGRAFEKSDDFLEAFVGSVSRAFFKNLEVVTEMHSFLDYLNSIGYGRVILMNSLDTLHFGKGPNVLRFRLHVTDLQWGEYPWIDLEPIVLNAMEPGEIPVYGLFSWSASAGG